MHKSSAVYNPERCLFGSTGQCNTAPSPSAACLEAPSSVLGRWLTEGRPYRDTPESGDLWRVGSVGAANRWCSRCYGALGREDHKRHLHIGRDGKFSWSAISLRRCRVSEHHNCSRSFGVAMDKFLGFAERLALPVAPHCAILNFCRRLRGHGRSSKFERHHASQTRSGRWCDAAAVPSPPT
jgi:hypothetical protein